MINIAGAFKKSHILIPFLLKNKNIEMCFYDGVNFCRWNGGRVNENNNFNSKIFDFYNKYDKGVFLTFSNRFIDNLKDPVGNELLNILNSNNINGVIICNESLRLYIKEKYQNLKLIYSITGHPSEVTVNNELLSYYKELELKYDLIVPRYEMVFNEFFIKNINPKKYEIMLNDTCLFGCNLWQKHFDKIAELNRKFGDPYRFIDNNEIKRISECWLKSFDPEIGSSEDREKYGDCLGMDLSPTAIKNAKKIGYCNWKISGRENNDELFKKDLEWYTKIV